MSPDLLHTLTDKETQIVSDYLNQHTLVTDLGMTDGIFGESIEFWKDYVQNEKETIFPNRLSENESALVWVKVDRTIDRFVEQRVFAIDKTHKRPNFSARFLDPDSGDVDYPVSVRNYTYEAETRYINTMAAKRPIPLPVVKQSVDILGCAPLSVNLESRLGFHINRVIYPEGASQERVDTLLVHGHRVQATSPARFKPFIVLSQSVFVLAPNEYVGRIEVEPKDELWVEQKRVITGSGRNIVFNFNAKTNLLDTPDAERYFMANGQSLQPLPPEEVQLTKELSI